ncbi:DUF3304 domain-containing protein [Paraburkholderia pallida]|uniref:DUF3304 domain-containing protein n=1 Tax=Paraburkholderia pallida TaxID=2547399 RepID=A0A4P7CTW1_9BURK|nr:DUF3304 domain-containing protein [Paraburkholderia pallida]QBQ97651.1 DUF3304 domain-containing protein [Paraburkholderia pallida]
MAQGRGKQKMGGLKKAMAALALLVVIGGCAIGTQRGYMMAPDTANYTDKYVDYSFYDTTGKPLGLGGEAKPFNKGGTGGVECCAVLPGPGESLRITWNEETDDDDPARKRTYTKDVVVTGSQPISGTSHNYLIVRFFPTQQLEVEFISEPVSGPRSPRRDRIFFGEHVMRHMGE